MASRNYASANLLRNFVGQEFGGKQKRVDFSWIAGRRTSAKLWWSIVLHSRPYLDGEGLDDEDVKCQTGYSKWIQSPVLII